MMNQTYQLETTLVHNYLKTELALGATQGPFLSTYNPFISHIHCVPLMTVSKKGFPDKRHIVLDFSYPKG